MSSDTPLDVLVITASNGENLKLAERLQASARSLGQRAELLDLTTLDLPLFTPRAQAAHGIPTAIAPLQELLATTPRWVMCAPEYNGSIPPCLSNAIAWLSVQGDDFRGLFNGRPIAIATHSGGGGHGSVDLYADPTRPSRRRGGGPAIAEQLRQTRQRRQH